MSGPSSTDGSLERRATIRLLHYWRSLPRGATLPAMSSFDPRRNPISWDHCFVVTDAGAGGSTSIEHLGAGLWAMLELPAPSHVNADRLPELLTLLMGDLAYVLASGEPVQRAGEEALPSGAILQFRSILLPFVDHSLHPRYGLGAVTMRLKPTN